MSFKVIGIGEVLWDLLPSGPQLGGAPVNFAYHARQMGADVQVITRVGKDGYGCQILQRFKEMNIDTGAVQWDDRLPTGVATVSIDGGTPHFTINNNAAWDALGVSEEALDAVRSASAICFGTLAQRSDSTSSVIQQLAAATSAKALRVFDVNLRQGFYSREILERSLNIANVLKLNDHELGILSPMFELQGDVRQKIEQLVARFDLRLVALTRADKGSLLHQFGAWSDLPGRKMEIVDTVGAGDAFTAALVMGLLQQFALEDIHRIAADVAGFVCSCPGATPVLPAPLCAAFFSNCASVRMAG
ncbi:MAG TPA: carbohydrate kinase [Verrucomicrobiae bacterium]|nr:carbohydrate kinase [Verrucomicrobiae bacterium]